MNPRTRSIRSRIVLLLLVPVLSLVALWSFTAVLTLRESLDHRSAERSTTRMRTAVQDIVFALGTERQATAAFLGGPADAPRTELDAARGRTDTAARAFRARAREELDAAGGPGDRVASALREALRELDRLPATRRAADGRGIEPVTAIEAYSVPVEAMYAFTERRAPTADGALYHWSAGLVAGTRAMDLMMRESALVAGAAAGDGRLTAAEHRRFVETVAAQRLLWAGQRAHLPAGVHGRVLAPLFSSPAYTGFRTLEEAVAGAPAEEAEVDARQWSATVQPLLGSLNAAHLQASRMLGAEQDARGRELTLRLSLAGGLGLVAVVASIFVAFRSGRGLVRELAALRAAAGPDPESAAATAGSRTSEIRQVAEAFTALRRTAAEATEGRAELRDGVNRVFLNIARRNQSLLHRQLAMLEEMREQGGSRHGSRHGAAAEPGRVERLGHLATRMRRHAESLIILSGASPGRGRREAVPVVEVLDEAVAEIEERDRVSVLTQSREGLVGGAVPDVVHMLAELLENAATFSPPSTGIRLLAERVGSGFAIEVEDRGLGMRPAELEELNLRLADPPEFDLADTDRLGLLVVARLAARHGARVSLRPSPYGGTTAIVVLPHELMVPAERVTRPGRALLAARPGPSGAPDALDGPAEPESLEGVEGFEAQASSVPVSEPEPVPESIPEAGPEAGPGPGPEPAPEAVPVLRIAGRTTPQNDQDAPEPGVPAAKTAPAGNPWFDDVAEPAAPVAGEGGVESREGDRPPAPGVGARTGANGAGAANGGGRPPEPAGTHAGLPRRRRQESLAPQLRRKHGTPPPPAAEQGPAGVIVRSPEEARSMMASIQRGWRRARASDPGDEEAR
ncbi:sensor histidine kinase [Spirillospora sp. CA-255316]